MPAIADRLDPPALAAQASGRPMDAQPPRAVPGPAYPGNQAGPAEDWPRPGAWRPTVFETTSMRLDDLLHHLAQGLLALPSFARPFLWRARESAWLLDSLFRGYPAGAIIVWEYRPPAIYRPLGQACSRRPPALLLADGRQRLTALYCALRGASPAAEGLDAANIRIAFSPLRAAFLPAGPKTRDNPEYIPDVAGLWRTPSSSRRIAAEYLSRLRDARHLDEDGQERACRHIDRLLDMLHYSFPVIELPARLGEPDARAVFTRANQVVPGEPCPSRRAVPTNRRLRDGLRCVVKNSITATPQCPQCLQWIKAQSLQAPQRQTLPDSGAGDPEPDPAGAAAPFPAHSIVAL